MDAAFWFLFHAFRLVLRTGQTGADALPCAASPPLPPASRVHAVGTHEGAACLACVVDSVPGGGGHMTVGLRASHDILGERLYQMAGKGRELIHWETHTRYCPACGVATTQATPRSQQCPSCGNLLFPSIAPAILALVRRKDSILLAHAHNFTGPHYGLLAGFLEPGENLEECARREVLEETGLEVGGITYFGSQPWPYPSGLMVGFVMDFVSGEIRIQEEELSHAAFFPRYDLPALPHPLSLARRMIDWWAADVGSPA